MIFHINSNGFRSVLGGDHIISVNGYIPHGDIVDAGEMGFTCIRLVSGSDSLQETVRIPITGVDDGQQLGNLDLVFPIIDRILAFLQLHRGVEAFHFQANVLKGNLMDFSPVSVLNVAYYRTTPEHIAIAEGDVFVLPAFGFQAQLHGSAPIAPQGATLHKNVRVVFKTEAVQTLDADGIVKGMDEAVLEMDPLAVQHINAIGVIAPLAKYPNRTNIHIEAMECADTIGGRVTESNALHPYIFTVYQL